MPANASKNSTFLAIQLLMLSASLSGLAGCNNGASAAAAYDPLQNRGEVDGSLPADARQRQTVVQSFLDALMPFNYHFDELPAALPQIRVTETKASFLGDKLALFGWAFHGSPRGNEVPVVVFLSEDDQGRPAGREERTYVVTGGPGGWVISRKR